MKEICIYYKNAPGRAGAGRLRHARARMAAAAEGQEGRIKKKSRFRASSAPIEIPFISRVAAAPHRTGSPSIMQIHLSWTANRKGGQLKDKTFSGTSTFPR